MKRYVSRSVVGSVVACAMLACGVVQADDATRANNPAECELFADIAIVARALVENQVDEKQQGPVLEAIYAPNNSRAKFVVESILGAARRAEQPALSWAGELSKQCLQREGSIKQFLGVAL
jgi:hypothetical protein